MSIIALFTILLSGPCGYWYRHIHHFHTESHPKEPWTPCEYFCACCPVFPFQANFPAVQSRCTVIFRGITLVFFLPPCGFCVTINLISSDLARECFPCNLATTRRCKALASTCQELDFLSLAPGANNRMQRDHWHQRLNSKKVYF